MNKPLRISLITIGSVIGFVLLVLLFVLLFGGAITKSVVEKHSPEWVGRQVTLDRPTINLFTGSVDLTNVHMLEADGKKDFVRFDSLYVQISLFRLLGKEVYLRHIWLTGLNAQVVNGDGGFNFQDIIDHFSSDEPKEELPKDTTSSGWGIGLYDIRFHNGAVSYVDRTRLSRWGLENIDIEVPGIYLGKDQTQAGVALDFPNHSGSLRLAAHMDQESGAFDVDLDLDTVRLDMAMPFVAEYARVSKLGSRLTGCFRAEGNLATITELGITGNVLLAETDIRDLNEQSILSLDRVSVTLDTIDLAEMRVDVSDLTVAGLHTTFSRWEDHNTISDLLVANQNENENENQNDSVAEVKADTVVADTIAPKPLRLLVRHVDIHDINLTYNDHTLSQPFSYAVTKLGVKADNLTLDGDNHVTMTAELPQGGSIFAAFDGGLNLHEDNDKISITVKNMQLAPFSPWCETYTATPLTAGSLSLTAEERINAGMLRGTNVVDIFGLTAGDKINPSDAPYKAVPVKLGIQLLEDLEHKIQISLPISGDINNPQFSLSKVIWKTVGNILLKATASPWVALGEAMGLGGDDLTKIAIDPLQPDFTSEQYAKVDKLVELMRQQQDLTLCLTQQFDIKKAIAEQTEFDKKRLFYESKYGAITALSLADIEEIRSIKDNNKEYREFSAPEPDEETVRHEVMTAADVRIHTLLKYLTEQQGLSASRVEVRMVDSPSDYHGSPMFAIGSKEITL